MRLDTKKFLFVGLSDQKKYFFEEAQLLGLIDFINISKSVSPELAAELVPTFQAIKILRGQTPVPQLNWQSWDKDKIEAVIFEILSLRLDLDKAFEKVKGLKNEIERIQPFGNFDAQDLNEIETTSGLKAYFFSALTDKKISEEESQKLIFVASEDNYDFYVGFSKTPLEIPAMRSIKIEKSLPAAKKELSLAETEISEINQKLKSLGAYSDLLQQALMHKQNHYQLHEVQKYTLDPVAGLFTVEGWVPENKVHLVQKLCDKNAIHLELIDQDVSEVAPTYLENEGMAKIGEDVIGVYDTPSSTDNDPSLWVLMAFGIFFAMIVGDGGYGAVYLGFCLWFKYKSPGLEGVKKRVLNLAIFLSSLCIVWGLMSNSFFGITLGLDNPIRNYSLVTWLVEKKADWAIAHPEVALGDWVKNYPHLEKIAAGKELIHEGPELLSTYVDNIMLEIALFCGMVHVITGMVRYINRNPAYYGWIIFIIGSYLYLPVYLGVPSMLNFVLGIPWIQGGEIGLQLIYVGFSLAIIIAVVKNKAFGLIEIMNVVAIFADILSYLRLYALGLAGGIMAGVINDAFVGLPLIFGILVALIAHGVNMGLGIMSGVVHGLRLNFLEWYHYSFEGNGRKFKPLDLKK